MWNLLEKRNLFSAINDEQGEYSPASHLANMIALLGPPPKELIAREREGLTLKWAPAAHNADGKLCTTASEWFGGPFFDENGKHMLISATRFSSTNLTLNQANSCTEI